MKREYQIMLLSFLAASILWLFDAFVDSHVFFRKSFMDSLIFDISIHEIYIRTFFGLTVILFGLVISRFVSRQREMEKTLLSMSFTDELTGLYNRRGFFTLSEQQLKLANRGKKDASLLSCDLDFLKAINDELGHQTGDEALKETADIFRRICRESDLIARIGGDEFVILALETPDSGGEAVVSRLKAALDAHNRGKDRKYDLSISTGMARYSHEHPCSINELLSRADKMMYEEKKVKH